MKCRLGVMFLIICLRSFSQTQTCPVNINFASGDLTHWFAFTGNNGQTVVPLIRNYDSNAYTPIGTIGARTITEYTLPSVVGIQVITYNGNDNFGGFPTIPTINGYSYNYSILLGSTAISRGNNQTGNGSGGYTRGVSYSIKVPPGPATVPYTMTYAYAMVLENGTHISSYQPLFTATLKTSNGIITCASPSYYLPTFNNVSGGGQGATLDSATAIKNGFSVSRIPSPNAIQYPNTQTITYLQDVWTKGWTEVTFDLSPYRGQQVSLTFEADNCVPGGHFAYAYVAIRNDCAGLMISGDNLVCNNSIITYSVPSLAGATYNWILPPSWTLLSSDTSNIIQVKSSSLGGKVSVREKNSCADLTDTVQINTLTSPEAGDLAGSTSVCEGINSSTLNLLNYSGVISNWLASTDKKTWEVISDFTPKYIADNLNATTYYEVVVTKGTVCPPDTSSIAILKVDLKSIGGQINPPDAILCAGQTAGEILSLTGNIGAVQDWQYSTEGISWTDLTPADTTNTYLVKGITSSIQYRLIVKNGICPVEASSIASLTFDPVPFPQAFAIPPDTTICFGTIASLHAHINLGTSYSWLPFLTGITTVSSNPFDLIKEVSPDSSSEYILTVLNKGCPNPLMDTLHVTVLAPVIVNAGHDTSVVVGEPIQFHARSSDDGPDTFAWFPGTELSDPFKADPSAVYNSGDNIIKYAVKATTEFGCSGVGYITVKVFKTKPDIFVPNAFTPGTSINTIFRPVPVGISSLAYFRIYNRLGQLVYNTSSLGSGWDGLLNGTPQAIGGYVWMVQGTDYTGTVITKKGTMVLIR